MLSVLPLNISAKDLGLLLGDELNALANDGTFSLPLLV